MQKCNIRCRICNYNERKSIKEGKKNKHVKKNSFIHLFFCKLKNLGYDGYIAIVGYVAIVVLDLQDLVQCWTDSDYLALPSLSGVLATLEHGTSLLVQRKLLSSFRGRLLSATDRCVFSISDPYRVL